MGAGRVMKWRKMKTTRLKIEDMATLDPREVPMYWLSEVALFTGVPASTVKRWTGQISGCKPLIIPPPDELQQQAHELRLSFANLLEAHILDATRKHDIPINQIRRGLEYLKDRFPNAAHPLLTTDFYSVPGTRHMFIRTIEGPVNISRYGQSALADILEKHLKRIEWDRSGPIRLMPMRSEKVVIDLNVAGGQPVLKGTGVLASVLAGRWRAGDTEEELATGYSLPLDDVRAAIRYIDAAAA
jgi:uncharacterized protein (DUF433 family)